MPPINGLRLDAQVGRMLDTLEQTEQGEDTLVIFVSDHGESLGDHYPRGKRSFYDGAARIPFALNWRVRLPAGAERDGRWACATWRDITFGELFDDDRATFMARDGRWKYAYAVNGGRELLFDQAADPDELVDRSGDPSATAEKARLRGALVALFRRDGLDRRLQDGDLVATPEREIHPGEVRGGIDSQGRDRAYAKFRKVPIADSIERNPLSGGQTREIWRGAEEG